MTKFRPSDGSQVVGGIPELDTSILIHNTLFHLPYSGQKVHVILTSLL